MATLQLVKSDLSSRIKRRYASAEDFDSTHISNIALRAKCGDDTNVPEMHCGRRDAAGHATACTCAIGCKCTACYSIAFVEFTRNTCLYAQLRMAAARRPSCHRWLLRPTHNCGQARRGVIRGPQWGRRGVHAAAVDAGRDRRRSRGKEGGHEVMRS